MEEKGGVNLLVYCFNCPSILHDHLGKEIPSLDSVSANPSISTEMYYETLEITFHMSRQQILQRAKRCMMLHTAYKSLKCTGCNSICIRRIDAQKRAQCLSLEVSGRSAYLGLKCDYFLFGSILRGPEIAMQGHIRQLQEKTVALAKCASKAL